MNAGDWSLQFSNFLCSNQIDCHMKPYTCAFFQNCRVPGVSIARFRQSNLAIGNNATKGEKAIFYLVFFYQIYQ